MAISQVKALDVVMFERSFDFDHFSKGIDSNVAWDQEIDYNYRNKQLL